MATNEQIMMDQKTLDDMESNKTGYIKYADNSYVHIGETPEEIKASMALAKLFKRHYYDKMFNDLYEEIKHGDEEHQDWLKNKIEEFKNKQLK